MSPHPDTMTATQIAAANRRLRDQEAADNVAQRTSSGPFADPPARPPTAVQAELRARLDAAEPAASAPTEPPSASRFAPQPRPVIIDGLIVPARSVVDSPLASWVLIPVAEVGTIGLTGRAVGITPKVGRWLPVWIGDDQAEKAAVFDQFAADFGLARRSRR